MISSLKKSLCGAATALLLAAAPATAHTLTLQLPDGSVEQIHYTGDVPPQVMVSPAQIMAPTPTPTPTPALAMDPAFASLARLAALMDQQEAAMMRVAEAAPALPGIAFANLPPGTTAYIATFSTDGACTKRTQITYTGEGATPREVSDTQGTCGPQHAAPPLPIRQKHIQTTPNPARIIQARANGAQPAAGMLREAVWRP